MKKYTGLLQGKLKQYDEAFADLDTATLLYFKIPFFQGLAVTQFNRAQVNFLSGDIEQAEADFLQVQQFWRTQGDRIRIFINNNFGLKLYHALNDQEAIDGLVAENEQIMAMENLPPVVLKNWESVKAEHFGN